MPPVAERRPTFQEGSSLGIRRQHETTTIPELRGARCSAFRAVRERESGFVGPLYLKLDEVWHRFYLDAGLLFWEEGPSPEPEEDLLEDEQYVDLAAELRVGGARVREIAMDECQAVLAFENGARLVLRNRVQSEGTEIVEARKG